MPLPFVANLRALWNPGMYHGHGRSADFFEGWYFKFVDAAGQNVQAVIPGVFLGRNGRDSHAFIQTLDGRTGRSFYHRFPLEAFRASERAFDLRVGPNRFWDAGLSLDLDLPEQRLRGELRFEDPIPWPVTLFSPGVMGWYAFVPFMECYHGVLGLDHAVQGALDVDERRADYSGGRGYIEKDWGQAFPQAWVWMQTNHFEQPGVSLSASVARIPWLGTAFRGFIVGLWHAGRLYRFATYNRSRVDDLRITDTHVHWRLSNADHTLEIEAERSEGGLLHAPMRTAMLARVLESLTATVRVRLAERGGGREVFAGVGRHAGLEVGGDVVLILNE